MTVNTLATLAMDIDARSPDVARAAIKGFKDEARLAEQQVRSLEGAYKSAAGATGAVGTASGQAEASMRGLVGVYGQARDALGRFAQMDGNYRLSADATVKMLLQNAKAVQALAKEQEQAAKAVAKAEADAARSREADMNATATLLVRNAQLQANLAKEQEQAAAVTQSYANKVATLRASLDPFAAVQVTLTQRTKLLEDALAHGAITAEHHAEMTAKVTAAARAGEGVITKYGNATKLTGQQLTNLSYQLNDVITGLASGQRPFQILAQQGGQIFQALQMGPGGVGGSLKALAGLLNPVTVGVAALGVAFGGLAIAAYDAEKRTAAFNTLAKGVGQDLGVTGGQLQALAATSAESSRASIKDAEAWAQAYVRLGVNNTAVLSRAVNDTKALAKALGVDGVNAAQDLGAALVDPIANVDALAKKTGGFDEALKENIKSLARRGELGAADALILAEIERRSGGAAEGVNTLSGAFDRLTTSIANYIGKAAKLVFVNPSEMQVAQTYSGFGYNPILENARQKVTQAANDNRDQAIGGAARDAFNSLLPKVQQIAAIRDQQAALQKTIDAGAGALKAANLTADQARQAIKEADKKIVELNRDKPAERAAARGLRNDDFVGDAAAKSAKDYSTAQLALTADVIAQADQKKAQIAQEADAAKANLVREAAEKKIDPERLKGIKATIDKTASLKAQAVDQALAGQLLGAELASRSAYNSSLDQMAGYAAAAAASTEERQAIELASLKRRQGEEAYALAETNKLKVSTGEISAMAAAEAELRQRNLAFAQTEDTLRKQQVAVLQENVAMASAARQDQIDLLSSQGALTTSIAAQVVIDDQIRKLKYDEAVATQQAVSDRSKLGEATAKEAAAAERHIAVLGEIYENDRKIAERQHALLNAYSQAVIAFSDMARSVVDGDVGGVISSLSTTLSKVSGLVGEKLGQTLGNAAGVLGPIGTAVSAVTSVLGAIGDASAAKAQAKIDRLTKAVEDLRTDNKTSSGSIEAALQAANANWNQDLEFSSSMLSSLRSIDAKTGAVASLIARQISSGSRLSTSGLGLGSTSSTGSLSAGLITGGVTGAALAGTGAALLSGLAGSLALGPIGLVAGAVGALVGALTKTKTTTETLDQGLQFTASTFDEISNGGVTGSSYADLLTTTKKSLLGVGYSTKVKTNTVTGAIDPALLSQISGTITLIGKGVLDAAAVFGDVAAKSAEDALGSAVVDLGKLSLKDLKPDEIASVLQATFDKVGDQLAAAGVPGLDDLATVGEGAFATLVRLAREYQVVDVSLASIGKTFGQVGLESVAARDALVQLFGGADEFASETSFFAQNFLSSTEQMAPVIKAVNDNLAQFGLSADSSREQFKNLVLGLDVSTASGQAAYAALMAVAPAFDKVASAAEAAATKRSSIQDEIDKLTLSSADLTLKQREAERAAAVAADASLGPLLDKLYGLQDAAATADKVSSIQDKIDQMTLTSAEITAKARAAELADAQQYGQSVVDLLNKQYGLEDAQGDLEAQTQALATASAAAARATDAATKAQEAQQEAMTAASQGFGEALLGAMQHAEELAASLKDVADELLQQLGIVGQAQSYDDAKAALFGNFNTSTDRNGVTSFTNSKDPDALAGLINNFVTASKTSSGSTASYRYDVAVARALALQESAKQAARPAQITEFWKQFVTDGGLTGFANGGSMMIGGNPGVDQNVLSINGVPQVKVGQGEILSVTPPGAVNDNGSAAIVAELKALREQVASQAADLQALRASSSQTAASNDKVERYIRNVTNGGNAMLTEAAS